MRSDASRFTADDGHPIYVHRFLPDADAPPPTRVLHIAHGMAEHGARYARLAGSLTAAGFAVYANDHRGHGHTAASPADLGFFAAHQGFNRAVRDLELLIGQEHAAHPGLPFALLGHSMGSFLCQELILQGVCDEIIKAVVLSGSAGKPSPLAQAGRLIARFERWRLGPHGRSKLLTALSFGDFNKRFAPTRTAFDWLSRDPAEVDKYIADPLCGFMVTTTLWVDVLDGSVHMSDPSRQVRIAKDLPVYLFGGDRDPVGSNGRSVAALAQAYCTAGLRRVTLRLYPDARHETLNETNRDEVTRDLIKWLDDVLP